MAWRWMVICSVLNLTLTFTIGCIHSIAGNSDGACCVFPYLYKGKQIRACTNRGFHKTWCSTTANYDADKKWGLCEECVRTVTGGCCKFPTTYQGKNYNKCITINNNRPWCFMENGKWDNCQVSACTNGWHYYKESCYRGYSDQKTWDKAREFCKATGTDLVKITSKEENEFVHRDLALPMHSAAATGMWIGLLRASLDRHFVWIDGQPLTYNNWSPNEPNDFQNNEGCTEMLVPAAYKAQWNDVSCKAKITFACEEVIGDPCKFRNGDCSQFCHSYDHGVNCTCRPGYNLGNDSRTCEDIDECLFNNGNCSHECVNTDGSYYCLCKHTGLGLSSDGETCEDIDECKAENGKCSHVCVNTWGSYHCLCTDPEYVLGNDNRTCAIPPQIIHPLANQTILRGSKLILVCLSTEYPPANYIWTKNGNSHIPRAILYNIQSSILSITNIQYGDRGFYECTARNQGGQARTGGYINVVVPPKLYNISNSKIVLEGDTVAMICKASGIPRPVVRWKYLKIHEKEVHTGEIYTITNVTSDHQGEYMCVADNGIGENAVGRLFLEVTYAPRIDILRSESRLISTIGHKVIISCRANGNPPPKYSWTKDGQSITSKNKANIKLAGKDIIVFPKYKEDFGTYKCTAKNNLGIAYHSVSLIEAGTTALKSALVKENTKDGSIGMTAAVILLMVTVLILIIIIAFMTYQRRRYSNSKGFVHFKKGATNPLHVDSEDLTHLQSTNSFNINLDEEE